MMKIIEDEIGVGMRPQAIGPEQAWLVPLGVFPKCAPSLWASWVRTLQQVHACLACWLAFAICLEPKGWHNCFSVACSVASHVLLYRCLSYLTSFKLEAPIACLALPIVGWGRGVHWLGLLQVHWPSLRTVNHLSMVILSLWLLAIS